MNTEIKTFEDACKHLGITNDTPNVSILPEQHQKAITAHYKLVIIAQALNDGWEPDWNNYSEYKYYPWFDLEIYGDAVPGSGFSYRGCVCGRTHSRVGSRLCYKSSDLAEYAGKQFLDLYKDYFVIQK
jgi:hypothetical protein